MPAIPALPVGKMLSFELAILMMKQAMDNDDRDGHK